MKWIVVSDFDGTLTDGDVGNALCAEFIPDRYNELQRAYRARELSLRDMQPRMWRDFPCSLQTFRERAVAHARLRPGVPEFLGQCADRGVPVYIASCGLRPYIEAVLESLLNADARRVIHAIRCNEARFEGNRLVDFRAPDDDPSMPYPLDKGGWCRELREEYRAQGESVRILGLGNGSSDRTFLGNVDELGATEALADYCRAQGAPHQAFRDFRDLLGVAAVL